jgi:nitrogen regulatory protein P-II 1
LGTGLINPADYSSCSAKEGKSMKLMKCIIRPNKLEEVREALSKLNVSGMTVSEVRGHGRQKGHKAIYRGREYSVTLLPKMMIEMVLPDDLVDEVLKVIIETARTGEIGDGRIFVLPVEQGYNIRTGERDVV